MNNSNKINIHIAEGACNDSLGKSHWWGRPDLPKGIEAPMIFICQINLADLPKACTDLPHEGLLLFFADIDYYMGYGIDPVIGMHISEPEDVKVIYVPKADMQRLERCSDAPYYAPQPLILNCEPTTLDEPDHQLLGTTDHLEWEDWPEPCQGWRLLLQMDSMETPTGEINFVDWGVLCFLIEDEALKRLDFSGVRAIILSS